ncbi:hypothetical protein H8356DRAFT_1624803 [Neocallimastix lanati (nom. inval.)]|nr:hypothetical protein H8356DRAFT_1624803 [Neocallimastix sp. JGI-2020a]
MCMYIYLYYVLLFFFFFFIKSFIKFKSLSLNAVFTILEKLYIVFYFFFILFNFIMYILLYF